MAFNTSRLIDQINMKGSLPLDRFSPQEILDIAYDALIAEVTPMLISLREEYYVRMLEFSITAGVATYPFPTRALGQTLREVQVIRGSEVIHLDRIGIEEVVSTNSGEPTSFYVMGNNVILYPTPTTTQHSLRLYFFLRPSKLVPVSECARISVIDTDTNTLTIAAPTTWSSSDLFDLIQGRDGFKIYTWDHSASAVSTTSITLDSLPTGLVVGDYVTLAGESCFAYLPTEAHVLLTQLAAAACLEDMGDQSNLQLVAARAAKIEAGLKNVFATRIQGAPKAIQTPMF